MINYSGKYFQLLLILLCLIISVLVSVIKYFTGLELDLSLFYIFPIILVTWMVGIWAGIGISFSSAILWLGADVIILSNSLNNIIPYLNQTFRLIVFLIITYIISELRNAMDSHKEQARTDSLTSISNKRAFYELADMELNKARRFKHTLSMLYIDLDNFKRINDDFGHHVGDTLLQTVADTIMTNIRAIDIAARLGGDEFCVLMSETGSESASTVAIKLNKMLSDIMRKNEWPVTFSIGAATFDSVPDSVNEMIKRTDALMYMAKKSGKNTIHHKVISY